MKKTIALVLCLAIISLFLVSCGSVNNEVKNELCGTWQAEYPLAKVTIEFRFDGTYYKNYIAPFASNSTQGTYKIEKDKIILTKSDGSNDGEIEYTYNRNSGKLYLTRLDVQMEKQ